MVEVGKKYKIYGHLTTVLMVSVSNKTTSIIYKDYEGDLLVNHYDNDDEEEMGEDFVPYEGVEFFVGIVRNETSGELEYTGVFDSEEDVRREFSEYYSDKDLKLLDVVRTEWEVK